MLVISNLHIIVENIFYIHNIYIPTYLSIEKKIHYFDLTDAIDFLFKFYQPYSHNKTTMHVMIENHVNGFGNKKKIINNCCKLHRIKNSFAQYG